MMNIIRLWICGNILLLPYNQRLREVDDNMYNCGKTI